MNLILDFVCGTVYIISIKGNQIPKTKARGFTMDSMTIANTIKDQLGRMTLMMIGTKQLAAIQNGIRIVHSCRGSKTNRIEITLNGLDLYDMKFIKVWGQKVNTIAEVENVYCDQLHEMIEQHTGLYTRI